MTPLATGGVAGWVTGAAGAAGAGAAGAAGVTTGADTAAGGVGLAGVSTTGWLVEVELLPVFDGWQLLVAVQSVDVGWQLLVAEQSVDVGWQLLVAEQSVDVGWQLLVAEQSVDVGWQLLLAEQSVEGWSPVSAAASPDVAGWSSVVAGWSPVVGCVAGEELAAVASAEPAPGSWAIAVPVKTPSATVKSSRKKMRRIVDLRIESARHATNAQWAVLVTNGISEAGARVCRGR